VRACWLVLLVGCGRVGFDGVSALGADAAGGGVTWSAPQPIPGVSSAKVDWAPAISADSQLLVLSSDRGGNNDDLYLATWTGNSWTTPVSIAALDTPSTETDPDWSSDGTLLYFSSDRGGMDHLYQSAYSGGAFAAPTLVPGLESVLAIGEIVSRDGLEMFFTDVSSGSADISRATRASVSDPWTVLGSVDELDSSNADGWPTLSADGLTMYLESDRSGKEQIYIATRPSIGAAFSTPALVASLADPNNDYGDPDLSSDGNTMYFSSNRSPTLGFFDLFESVRTP
jgi:Tol biopolymer transport system component